MKYRILMYHGVNSITHRFKGGHEEEEYWVIDIDQLWKQMQMIYDLKLDVVLLREIQDVEAGRTFKQSYNKPIVLTFDDGHETSYFNALPVLNHFGFKAEFFITAGWIGKEPYMNEEQLLELRKHGMSIQSHGWSHKFLTELNDIELMMELVKSKRMISEKISNQIHYISYPGGRYDKRTERMAIEAGYKGSCTSIQGFNMIGKEMFGLKREPITNDTPEDYFRALLTNDVFYFARRGIRGFLGALAQRCLGNENYQRVKSLRGKQRDKKASKWKAT